MSKSGDILNEWSKIKLQKDIQQKDILDAVGRYESGAIAGEGDVKSMSSAVKDNPDKVVKTDYNPNIKQQTKEIPEGYAEALARLKKFQEVLTPELLKKHPEAKVIYDTITKQGVERMNAFKDGVPDYYLTDDEQKNRLGKDYNQYVSDLSLVSRYLNSLYPGLAEVAGTKEGVDTGVLKYGLRTASLGQYTGEPRSVSDVEGDIQKYSQMTGNVKH